MQGWLQKVVWGIFAVIRSTATCSKVVETIYLIEIASVNCQNTNVCVRASVCVYNVEKLIKPTQCWPLDGLITSKYKRGREPKKRGATKNLAHDDLNFILNKIPYAIRCRMHRLVFFMYQVFRLCFSYSKTIKIYEKIANMIFSSCVWCWDWLAVCVRVCVCSPVIC